MVIKGERAFFHTVDGELCWSCFLVIVFLLKKNTRIDKYLVCLLPKCFLWLRIARGPTWNKWSNLTFAYVSIGWLNHHLEYKYIHIKYQRQPVELVAQTKSHAVHCRRSMALSASKQTTFGKELWGELDHWATTVSPRKPVVSRVPNNSTYFRVKYSQLPKYKIW